MRRLRTDAWDLRRRGAGEANAIIPALERAIGHSRAENRSRVSLRLLTIANATSFRKR